MFALLSQSSPSPALSEIVDLGLRLSSTASSDPYRVPWTSFRITSPLGTTKALLLRRAICASSDASVILQAEGPDSLVAAFHDEGVQTARGRQFPLVSFHPAQPRSRHSMANDLSTSSSREPKTAIRFLRIRKENNLRPALPLLPPSRPQALHHHQHRIWPRPANLPMMPCQQTNNKLQCLSISTFSNTRAHPALRVPIATTSRVSLPVSSSARALL